MNRSIINTARWIDREISRSYREGINDVFRNQALRAVSEGLATQRTVGDTAGRLLMGIVEAGHDGFVDRAGRHWRLDRYVDMAAQTTTREAVTTGTLNQLTDLGYDLVQITEHSPTCAVCSVHQGRVRDIRTAELNAMKSSEVRAMIGQGRGNWPMHRGEYHLQRHGFDFGANTVAAYQQAARNIVQNASRVYTQYHAGQKTRQWIYAMNRNAQSTILGGGRCKSRFQKVDKQQSQT